ncbi:hypothetical protein [Ketogulonicigenium vulgare]|uniref:hypothetical protein n=1 Tax=Ketogulonicigenium vulgare TaxID=92945 RepID=UPI0012EAB238|nr:hypothetical protein [Ketogulonicigenium vulgare]
MTTAREQKLYDALLDYIACYGLSKAAREALREYEATSPAKLQARELRPVLLE